MGTTYQIMTPGKKPGGMVKKGDTVLRVLLIQRRRRRPLRLLAHLLVCLPVRDLVLARAVAHAAALGLDYM